MMNGFLPTTAAVRLSQWWQTRDQGDSLAVAQRLADMDRDRLLPRNALVAVGSRTLYLDGSQSPGSSSGAGNCWPGRRAQGKNC